MLHVWTKKTPICGGLIVNHRYWSCPKWHHALLPKLITLPPCGIASNQFGIRSFAARPTNWWIKHYVTGDAQWRQIPVNEIFSAVLLSCIVFKDLVNIFFEFEVKFPIFNNYLLFSFWEPVSMSCHILSLFFFVFVITTWFATWRLNELLHVLW